MITQMNIIAALINSRFARARSVGRISLFSLIVAIER